MKRSIALYDPAREVTSTIKLPEHATPDQCARILASAMILASARRWHVVTSGIHGRITLAALGLVDACETPRKAVAA